MNLLLIRWTLSLQIFIAELVDCPEVTAIWPSPLSFYFSHVDISVSILPHFINGIPDYNMIQMEKVVSLSFHQ